MNIEMLMPSEQVTDEEFMKLYHTFMVDLTFTVDRLDKVTKENIPELIYSTSDNCRILKEWYEKLLKADVPDFSKDLKEACTKVTERLIGCFGALCHALKMLNGPDIVRYGSHIEIIAEDFEKESKQALKEMQIDLYKIECEN